MSATRELEMYALIKHLENQIDRKNIVLNLLGDALDALYGANGNEPIPVTLLPKDRQELFHKLLEAYGNLTYGDMP